MRVSHESLPSATYIRVCIFIPNRLVSQPDAAVTRAGWGANLHNYLGKSNLLDSIKDDTRSRGCASRSYEDRMRLPLLGAGMRTELCFLRPRTLPGLRTVRHVPLGQESVALACDLGQLFVFSTAGGRNCELYAVASRQPVDIRCEGASDIFAGR